MRNMTVKTSKLGNAIVLLYFHNLISNAGLPSFCFLFCFAFCFMFSTIHLDYPGTVV